MVELRTTRSSTWLLSDGTYETETATEPLNYRDPATGALQPVSNELVAEPAASPWAVRNEAAAHVLRLPDDLAGAPVSVSQGPVKVEFSLQGAEGVERVAGEVATYDDALPGVDVAYAALATGVKETLTLADRSAASSYGFDLVLSPGTTARNADGGGVEIVGAAGPVFTFLPPWMSDASGDPSSVSYDVSLTTDGRTMTLIADAAWLAAPERQYPVVIDPTGIFNETATGPQEDLFIRSGAQTATNYRDDPALMVGRENGETMRSLLRFDVSSIARESQVVEAELKLWNNDADTNTTVTRVGLHEPTEDWNGDATWTKRDATTAWSSPGGRFNGTLAAFNNSVGPGAGFESWYPTDLVQRWVSGATINRGLLLKAVDESPATRWVRFDAAFFGTQVPSLIVRWKAWLGSQDFLTFEGRPATDTTDLSVNVANGNLLVTSNDVAVAGTGLDLNITSTYNSRRCANGGNGLEWVSSATDVFLEPRNSGALVTLPSGTQAPFTNRSSGGYDSPRWLRATLDRPSGGPSYRLRYWDGGEELTFDATGRLASNRTRTNNTITYNYGTTCGGGGERLCSVSDTQGDVTTLRYQPDGYLDLITDPFGRTVNYEYFGDALIGIVNRDGKRTTFEYTSSDLTAVVTPEGRRTQISYNANDQVTSLRYIFPTGDDPLYRFVYNTDTTVIIDPRTPTQSPTDPAATITTYRRDALNRVRIDRVTDDLGRSRTTTYSATSRITSSSGNDTSAATTSAYSQGDGGRDNLESVTSPEGASTRFTYDRAAGAATPYSPLSRTDTQGNTSTFGYDGADNLTSNGTRNPVTGQDETYMKDFNPDGTVAFARDPRGVVSQTAYSYVDGNLTRVNYPTDAATDGLGDDVIRYDNAGRPDRVTDGRGKMVDIVYDNMDRVIWVIPTPQPPPDQADDVFVSYDGDGNLVRRDDITGVTTFTHDAMNRLSDRTNPGGEVIRTRYDVASNLSSYEDAGGFVDYFHDNANNLLWVQEPNTSGRINFRYDNPDNLRTETQFPNGVTQYAHYDRSGRVDHVWARRGTAAPFFDVTYRYSGSYCFPCADTGLRQSTKNLVDGSETFYTYDHVNRLKGVEVRNSAGTVTATSTYFYDAAGNRTGRTEDGSTLNFFYNEANELKSEAGPGATTYEHDAAGNETRAVGRRSADYSHLNQASRMTRSGLVLDNIRYADADSTERVAAGGTTFTYGALGLASEDPGASPTRRFTRDDKGNLLGERIDAARSYYVVDALGSVVHLTEGGATTATYTYDAWGTITNGGGAGVGSAATRNPWRFAGGYHDTETKLTKFGTRYYDAELGRWTQQDPLTGAIASPGTLNRYAYAGSNPVNYTDPSGYNAVSDFFSETLGVGDDGVEGEEYLTDCLAYGAVGAVAGGVLGGGLQGALVGGLAGCTAATIDNLL